MIQPPITEKEILEFLDSEIDVEKQEGRTTTDLGTFFALKTREVPLVEILLEIKRRIKKGVRR